MNAKHLVLTTMTATAPGAGGAAATAVSGDSLTVRNYGSKPRIIGLWGTNQTAGFAQLAFPTGHDTTRGFRAGIPADTTLALALGLYIPITPQEVIAGTIAGSAVAGDVEQCSWLTRYDEDKGQKFIDWPEVLRRTDKVTTIEASLVSAAGPNYSGTESIDTDSNLLIANRDYALLGFSTRTRVHAIGWTGPDFGNDRVASPGIIRPELSAQWFKLLSAAHGEALIPVFNSGNRAQTNWFVHTDENAGTFVGTAHIVLLK